MSGQSGPDETALASLARPLALTRAGMVAERAVRAFWPAWTVAIAAVAAVALGLHETLPVEAVWLGLVGAVAGFAVTLWRGLRRFRLPTPAEAIDRLDRTLPGRPISALTDAQAIGAGDAASEAVWRAHQARMAARAAQARAVAPDLRLAARDPFALRYIALTALAVSLLFGSVWRVTTLPAATGGPPTAALANGSAWEGWITPPAHTGRPALYLPDIPAGPLELPEGSRVSLRFYGEAGTLALAETVSGGAGAAEPAATGTRDFTVVQSGEIAVLGPKGRRWTVTAVSDLPPTVVPDGPPERLPDGAMRQGFRATDDHGVVAGRAEIRLDLAAADRRHGLAPEPEPRETLILDLPMPIRGDRRDFAEVLVEDLARHPWAGLPVTMVLVAVDAVAQEGRSTVARVILPGRRFFDPLAAAVAEQRRDLLWTRANAVRVAQVLRTLTHRPEDLFRDRGIYLQLRVLIRRLEAAAGDGSFTPEVRDEVAEALWQIALKIEEGDLSDALERLRRAQQRLEEAMRNGATDAEIAGLLRELREAMDDYMRQLAERGQTSERPQMSEDMREITGDELQAMLDEIERLMQEGRMAEAQALLDQLMQMMQNMQVTQGEGGQGQRSPGRQAMENLAESLREQQGLSDEAFRELQERFNPGQRGEGGRQGQQGEGEEGQAGGQGGQGGQQGLGQGRGEEGRLGRGDGGDGMPDARSLADRQGALRRELERQRQNLPGAGTPEGDAARDALGRAGRAMDRAEEALRRDDLAGALDDQSEALEALREGLRALGEAVAQEERRGDRQGAAASRGEGGGRRDPLGREAGNMGRIGTDQNLLPGEDVSRRAEELIDEIRRRSGDQTRPELERDYLERLLDRF